MKFLFALLLVTVVNLLPKASANVNADCPNFQGSFVSPNRIYDQDVTQVDVYQTKCEKLTYQHYPYKGGIYLTDASVHETDGTWRVLGNQKQLSVLLPDRFVTVSNNTSGTTIATRKTWTLLGEHILVVDELIDGEVKDANEVIPSERIRSKRSTLLGRIRGN